MRGREEMMRSVFGRAGGNSVAFSGEQAEKRQLNNARKAAAARRKCLLVPFGVFRFANP